FNSSPHSSARPVARSCSTKSSAGRRSAGCSRRNSPGPWISFSVCDSVSRTDGLQTRHSSADTPSVSRLPGSRRCPLILCQRRVVPIVCALLYFALTAKPLAAQDVTFRFSGTITRVETSPLSDIVVGTPFSGTYTFSLATPNESRLPQVGDYVHRSAPYGV